MAIIPIDPIKLAQAGDIAPVSPAGGAGTPVAPAEGGSIFDSILGRAVDALDSVSAVENNANHLIDLYVQGKAELSDVMLATSKMTLDVSLAVTAITNAVSSFKEVTSISI